MGVTYFPNDTATIFLQVLRLSGSVPSFPANYSTPQIRILHISGGSPVTDLAFTNMTQVDDNIWSIDFPIVAAPFFGDYIAEFQTTLDSIAIESSDTFKVSPTPDIIEQGQGSCQVDAQVKDEGTLQPIVGATVLVFDPGDLNNAIAKDVTDGNGDYTVFLNPGSYKIRFTKVGFIDETHDLTVNANCTHVISGD